MKFFLDTANIDQIKQALDWGLCDGVTTNPTIIAREGREMREAIEEICELVEGRPVSAEVLATDAEGMIEEARERASWAENVVVKIPLIPEGIKAMSTVTREGVRVNATLIFSTPQALLAAKAGASYLSPFVGRLDDIGHDGMLVVEQIAEMLRNYEYFNAEIIVSSVRQVAHVIRGVLCGAHIATLPFESLEKLFNHPMTDLGLEGFLADYATLQEELEK
jgi:transaldolase